MKYPIERYLEIYRKMNMSIKERFTHYAKFYGIPCYFNDSNDELVGRNKIYDLALDIAIFIEQLMPSNPDGFPIQITGEIK